MRLPCQDIQAIAIGVRESRAESGLLVHERWLGQVPHCHGCLGFPGARVGWAQALVEVLCCPSSSMVGLQTVPCACRSMVGVSWEARAPCRGARFWGPVYPTCFRRMASVGFGCTARGRSFVYHASTTMDGADGACGSRGGMVSWARSLQTPCSAWYWCHATRSLKSTRRDLGMCSHNDLGIRKQDTWCKPAADALAHHPVTMSCHGPHVSSHMFRNATFHRMQ